MWPLFDWNENSHWPFAVNIRCPLIYTNTEMEKNSLTICDFLRSDFSGRAEIFLKFYISVRQLSSKSPNF